MALSAIPIIDPSVKHVGVSKLRGLNATKLKESKDTLVIQDNDKPLAVLLSYDNFLLMQQQYVSVINTIEMLTDDTETKALAAGLDDLRNGRTRSFDEIEADLKAGK